MPDSNQTFSSLRLACVQCTSGTNPQANLDNLAVHIQQAVAGGAQLVALPEGANQLRQEADPELFYTQQDDPFVQGIARLAGQLGCWIVCGSALLREGGQLVNRSLVFDQQGQLAASYDKVHLFSLRYKQLDMDESRQFRAGNHLAMASTPWGKVGLSICYDLRFPALYRALCLAGASMLTVPSAFTRPTGKAHWRSLLRARAIENASFVLAPAQAGCHQDGRTTYGHSMIIDPWGTVLAEADGESEMLIFADLVMDALVQARGRLSAWATDERYSLDLQHCSNSHNKA